MARFFQIPNFRRDEYQRPEQKWVCGRQCDGKGCAFGPDSLGRCHTTGECRPVRNGDRWDCTRPETHGGTCEAGPLPDGGCCHPIGPCQPLLSMRARRGRWLGGAAALTAGLLLVALAGSSREKWMDPGPLASAHALSNTRCGDCHASLGDTRAGGLRWFLAGVHSPSSSDCLRCHDLGRQPLSPHGLDEDALGRIHRDLPRAGAPTSHSVVLAIARGLDPRGASRECSICHQEHHGRSGLLTGFTDQQCQVCHVRTFDSFSQGHPEFADYPFRRRTRLVFDHASHLQEHFAQKDVAAFAPKDCAGCHAASTGGEFMVVGSFERTCAACHGAEIEGEGRAGDKGVAFFRVPGLDAETLSAWGHPVGEWPTDADGGVTPFERLLLARDPAAAAALRTLGSADLSDLRGASDERMAAAGTLAWALKSLFADLVTGGQEAMISRLSQIDPGGDHAQLRAMTAQIPRDGLIAAQVAWFPSLFTEVANHRAGIKPVPASAGVPRAAAQPPASQAPKSAGDADLLGGDDLSADAPHAAPPAAKPASAPVKAAGDDLLGGDDLAGDTKAPTKAASPTAPPAVAPLTVSNAEDWTTAGGWYRSADNPTLFYRPAGHADPFLTIWLTESARLSADPVARALFSALADPKAPGLCMKCHSVDRAHGDTRMVNWDAGVPSETDHPITKFSHSAHFSMMGGAGCQTCHQMKAQSAYLAAFGGNLDPARFESNFAHVSKATCAGCHNDKVAGEGCQLCHNYHTGEFAARVSALGPMKPVD
jgi:hypothetical protein